MEADSAGSLENNRGTLVDELNLIRNLHYAFNNEATLTALKIIFIVE